jgi:hypothetical protein
MANPKLEVLTPQNSQIIFIDHQPQMAFGVQSIDRQTLKNNVVALAKAAKAFKNPDHHHHGRDGGVLRLHIPRVARRVS